MGSYRQIFYQIVFGTKYRQHTLCETHCEELYRYISGIIRNKHCKVYCINGVEDHIHIASDLHPEICLAEFIKAIKVASSVWMKASGKFPEFQSWQVGYGAFTYSHWDKEKIINYVKNQKQHHLHESSIDEYKRLLIQNGIEFDEKYLE